MGKEVHITASTGISRLHFKGGHTLHHWSSYGDGHLNVQQLLQEILISSTYESTRVAIQKCEVLIIDEIGMISAKMFAEVELLCRSVRQNSLVFGGIQVIGCGSFLQLPPVPSSIDNGDFAFQSSNFTKVFPHKINLQSVHRQKELDFVRAINDLCEGNATTKTHQLMMTLKRPLTTQVQPLFIFGTNYDVDFFNHMKLQQIQSQEFLFTAEDTGNRITSRRIGANKYLMLKLQCKVVISRNLYNGLVNGLSATVLDIMDDKVRIQIDDDKHLQHSLQGKQFEVTRYTFVIRDANNSVTSVRRQFPLKLGYSVTVDKSQGRTLESVVVDSSNFWRPGQLGVAVGRATCKEALQVSRYSKNAACLKHPQVVTDFYNMRSLMMRQDLLCCNKRIADEADFLVKEPSSTTMITTEFEGTTASEYLDNQEINVFPFDISDYVKELVAKIPNVTHIQQEQIQLLQDAASTESFKKFLSKAFSVVSDIFQKYKISGKKNKCNWCRMCSHLHSIFASTSYKSDVIAAFQTSKVRSNENAICTRIYFNLLETIAKQHAMEAKDIKLKKFSEQTCDFNLDELDKSSLRYIAGAAIHSVRNHLEDLSMKQIMNDEYKSKLNHRKHQLTCQLIGSPQLIQNKTCEPESLLKIIERDYGGLLYVTDQTFEFFKLLLLKTRQTQNIMTVQIDPENVFIKTYNKLINDTELITLWLNLFANSEADAETCLCPNTDTDIEESELSSNQHLIELELDEMLVCDLMEAVIMYFCKVHCAEKVLQLKDYVLEKPKTFQLRHTLDENAKKKSAEKSSIPLWCLFQGMH